MIRRLSFFDWEHAAIADRCPNEEPGSRCGCGGMRSGIPGVPFGSVTIAPLDPHHETPRGRDRVYEVILATPTPRKVWGSPFARRAACWPSLTLLEALRTVGVEAELLQELEPVVAAEAALEAGGWRAALDDRKGRRREERGGGTLEDALRWIFTAPKRPLRIRMPGALLPAAEELIYGGEKSFAIRHAIEVDFAGPDGDEEEEPEEG